MPTKCVILRAVIACFLTPLAAVSVSAQSYPNRLIKLVLPFPAGGPTDGAARLIAERLSASLGQTVVIENRAGGAGGTVGAKSVATAEPDGYTLLFTPPGPLATAPLIYKNVGYDPVKDFAPVATIFSSPQVLVVNPTVPANSMQELVAYAKANPGKVNMGSSGIGSVSHIFGERFKMMTGIQLVHVPYRGGYVADLLGGQVQIVFGTISSCIKYIRGGLLRALAVTTATRSDVLPDIPTLAEFVPGYEVSQWYGVGAPKDTPAEVIDKLNKEINAAVASDPVIKLRFAGLGVDPMSKTPAEFEKFIADETEKWGKVIRAANLTAD
jgi:tripartite-type tricarboxylate transporter receptor subunit TctC